MTTYTPPLKDFHFILHDVLKVQDSDIPGYDELDPDFTSAILDESGKICRDVLHPLNAIGDTEGCRIENGVVRTPTGFKEAFDLLREGGWPSLDCEVIVSIPSIPASRSSSGWVMRFSTTLALAPV